MRDEFEDDYYVAEDQPRQGWRGRLTERMSTWLGAALALAVIGGLVLAASLAVMVLTFWLHAGTPSLLSGPPTLFAELDRTSH